MNKAFDTMLFDLPSQNTEEVGPVDIKVGSGVIFFDAIA